MRDADARHGPRLVARGEMEKAKYWYAEAAERGDTAAMFHLGWVHDQAIADDAKAAARARIERGSDDDPPASPKVSRGSSGKTNYDLASRWYRMAANRGFAPAMNNFGTLQVRGPDNRGSIYLPHYWRDRDIRNAPTRDLVADRSRAFVMFKWAAKLGNPVGQWNLSVAYTAGIGVTLNAAQAEKWAAWTPPATAMADLDEPTLARTRLLPTTLSASQREAVRTSARTGESVTMSHVLLRRKSSRCYWIASLCR